MQLKKYQNETLAVIKAFFDALDTKSPGEAYESVTASVDMIARLGKLRHYEELLSLRGVSEARREGENSKNSPDLQNSKTPSSESNNAALSVVGLDVENGFAFDAAMYADAPLMKVYRGGTRFAKHYLGPNCVPAFDGEKKDGEGEEFDCAVQIDAHPAVRFWLRNLAKHHRSFSLPLSHDSFYPDFVGELTDGRLFAVEYKGEHLRNAKDTLEKDAIGRLWASKSGGKCLYATVYKSEGGLDVRAQLDRLFGGNTRPQL